jgi:Pyruvate/2-oxoacid:ferredoxin oxidoreductase delta subunit
MKKCFTKAKLSSIVTLGDSNAQKYYTGMFQMMKTFSKTCRQLDIENLLWGGFLPDKRYFTKGRDHEIYENVLNVHYRFCSGCGARNGQCTWEKAEVGVDSTNDTDVFLPRLGSTVTQHFPITMILETAVSVLVPFDLYKGHNYSLSKYEADTSPEFFFKLYLENKYPDVMLIFLPFNHIATKHHLQKAPAEIKYFHALVKLYIPRTTKVFYMPAFSEFEAKKNEHWRNRTVDGLSGLKRMDKLNHILHDVIKDDVTNASSGIYSFLDLVDMSRDRLSWSTDGVHMQPVWYKTVVSYFWEIFCNSLSGNNF